MNAISARQKPSGPSAASMNGLRRPIGVWNVSLHGPITIAFPAIGFLAYHAGSDVHVIDEYGLADPFIARCPAPADSRPGHIEYIIPAGYMEARGVVNELPDWQRRIETLDPTLAVDARAMMQNAHWTDPSAYRRWQATRRIISGPLWSSERWAAIPAYAAVAR